MQASGKQLYENHREEQIMGAAEPNRMLAPVTGTVTVQRRDWKNEGRAYV